MVTLSSGQTWRGCAMQCVAKPEGDIYKFTHFAHKLMSGKGINPLSSDARRRRDRLALQVWCLHTIPMLWCSLIAPSNHVLG